MVIEDNIFDDWRVGATILQNLLRSRWFPLHFMEVYVTARVDNVVAADKINVAIRAEYDCVPSRELDPCDKHVLLLMHCLSGSNFGRETSLLVISFGLLKEWFLELTYRVLSGQTRAI